MTTFDSWEVGICPDEDYLMHWGIPGMKHGRRRYQNEDGTWTPVGLAERRKREGFGEDKRAAKAQKKIARAEKHQARKAARAEARQARAEKKRLKSLKGLTDEELQKKINRVKMEQEYKELTKSPLLKSGERLVSSIMEYKANKDQRIIDLNNQKLDLYRQRVEMERTKTQRIQAKEMTKQSRYRVETSKNEAHEAWAEANKMKQDRKAGLKIKRKAELKDAKTRYKAESRGAIRTWLKNKANKDKEERQRAHEKWMETSKVNEQREKRINAENVAKANADQAKYKIDQEKHKASQENYKASQERYKASQSASERKWRETQAQTEYEREKKKKP